MEDQLEALQLKHANVIPEEPLALDLAYPVDLGGELYALLQEESGKVVTLTQQVEELTYELVSCKAEVAQLKASLKEAGNSDRPPGSPSARAKQLAAELHRQMLSNEHIKSLQSEVSELQELVEMHRELQVTQEQDMLMLNIQLDSERKKAFESKGLIAQLRSRIEELQRSLYEKDATASVLALQIEELEKMPECTIEKFSPVFELEPCARYETETQTTPCLSVSSAEILNLTKSTRESTSQTSPSLAMSSSALTIPPGSKKLKVTVQKLIDIPHRRMLKLEMPSRAISESTESSGPNTPIGLQRRPTRNFTAVRKAPMEEFFTLVKAK
mmetsp:Transcript_34565/g.60688  ORF Transcript_34565/g.60688 Transcript_34565/m.60688 type:complete len:329 (+) Transcript_34565:46-1032(+)